MPAGSTDRPLDYDYDAVTRAGNDDSDAVTRAGDEARASQADVDLDGRESPEGHPLPDEDCRRLRDEVPVTPHVDDDEAPVTPRVADDEWPLADLRDEPRASATAAPRDSIFDRWRDRLAGKRWFRPTVVWGLPILLTLVAAFARMWHLGFPHTLVFDETYYVKDAWSQWHLGYEGSWPQNPDQDFNAGHPDGYSSAPSFVAHPPLGKWIIGLGMAIFGGSSSVGWRIAVATLGTLAVPLLYVIALKLLRRRSLAFLAALFLAIDGLGISLSRVSLLDNILMFFGLVGFGFIVLDREWQIRRLADPLPPAESSAERDARVSSSAGCGPILWWRPWLMAAAATFGFMAAVKWSGFYFLAVFCIVPLVTDLVTRIRAGYHKGVLGTLLQVPVTFVLTVPIALATFLVSWAGWFASKDGYDRQWAEQPGNAWTGLLAWVPRSLQSLWHYETEVYGFHTSLAATHPYQANPLTWLLLVRPTQMYFQSTGTSCGSSDCVSDITSMSNPILWWAASASVFMLIGLVLMRRNGAYGLILAGVAAGYLPWMMYLSRNSVFQFYTVAFLPYMALALAAVAGEIMGTTVTAAKARTTGIAIVSGFTVLCVAVSVFFYPIWIGASIPRWFWTLHMWLPTWI